MSALQDYKVRGVISPNGAGGTTKVSAVVMARSAEAAATALTHVIGEFTLVSAKTITRRKRR